MGLSDDQLEQLKQQANQQIEASVAFAEASPEPRVESVMEGVYA
jgi:TPP-dependent pyruvate/acetoin dehydrogenase alpha subunit